MKMTGAEMIMEILLENGVDTVFGYPGGTALFIYDALYKYSDRIKHVLTAHEQGASHAADGYARSTGKVGVAFATSGPGATNLVTGIATAYMDSIPTVFITANVGNSLIGRDAFQEVCITGVTFPITKHNFFVNKLEDLADAMRSAFKIANEGRKGPVLVDITKDLTDAIVDYEPQAPLKLKSVVDSNEDPKIESFAKIINEAQRPVLMVGGGVIASGASYEVRELMKKADIPAVTTLMGIGAVPVTDPNCYGLVGMHGSYAANKIINEADLVVALGTRFSDRVALKPDKFAPRADIIQIDIDRSEVDKNVKVKESIIGDVKDVIADLLPHVNEAKHTAWLEEAKKYDEEHPLHIKSANPKLDPEKIIKHVNENTDKETIFVTDVGQHQMWAAQYCKHETPRDFLSSGGLGTMGYGYGAAIGAQFGNPDKRVIHYTGDGSFHMNLNEACTAVSNDLPIITIILNNTVLGMVYQWQTKFYGQRYSNTTPNRKTDFAKVIDAFGGKGYKVETQEEFEAAFKDALTQTCPTWIDCRIQLDELVLPMIPNGNTIEGMLFE